MDWLKPTKLLSLWFLWSMAFLLRQVRKNARFKRLGDDLMADVHVSLSEVACSSCDFGSGSGCCVGQRGGFQVWGSFRMVSSGKFATVSTSNKQLVSSCKASIESWRTNLIKRWLFHVLSSTNMRFMWRMSLLQRFPSWWNLVISSQELNLLPRNFPHFFGHSFLPLTTGLIFFLHHPVHESKKSEIYYLPQLFVFPVCISGYILDINKFSKWFIGWIVSAGTTIQLVNTNHLPQALLGFQRQLVHLDGHIVSFGMERGDVPCLTNRNASGGGGCGCCCRSLPNSCALLLGQTSKMHLQSLKAWWLWETRDGCYGLLTDVILQTVINHYSAVGLY